MHEGNRTGNSSLLIGGPDVELLSRGIDEEIRIFLPDPVGDVEEFLVAYSGEVGGWGFQGWVPSPISEQVYVLKRNEIVRLKL